MSTNSLSSAFHTGLDCCWRFCWRWLYIQHRVVVARNVKMDKRRKPSQVNSFLRIIWTKRSQSKFLRTIFSVPLLAPPRPPLPPQCLGGSTIFPFSKCFWNSFFCVSCNSHTYSHPFLDNLVLFKQIWPIYDYDHFSVTKKWQKIVLKMKQLKMQDYRFPSSNFDFFLLKTSQT